MCSPLQSATSTAALTSFYGTSHVLARTEKFQGCHIHSSRYHGVGVVGVVGVGGT